MAKYLIDLKEDWELAGVGHLLAAMTKPNKSKGLPAISRILHVADAAINLACKDAILGEKDSELMDELIQQFKKTLYKGAYAGGTLIHLIILHNARMEYSLGRASYCTKVIYHDPIKRPLNGVSAVEKAWSKLKNVAHLWAAIKLIETYNTQKLIPQNSQILPQDIIYISNKIIEYLEQHQIPQELDWKNWNPICFSIEGSFDHLPFNIAKPTAEFIELMSQYTAHNSHPIAKALRTIA